METRNSTVIPLSTIDVDSVQDVMSRYLTFNFRNKFAEALAFYPDFKVNLWLEEYAFKPVTA